MGSYSPLLPLIYCILLLTSVNYPSYFTESLYGIIPAGRPFSEGRFYIISISIIFNLLWCEEWGQHKDPHKAVGPRQRGTWNGPMSYVKEWVLHQKDLAAKWHPRMMETDHKNPASLALQSLTKVKLSIENPVCLSFLYQTLVASARDRRRRDIWPHKLPHIQSSRDGLQNQGLGIDAVKICPCGKLHVHEHRDPDKSHLWCEQKNLFSDGPVLGKWEIWEVVEPAHSWECWVATACNHSTGSIIRGASWRTNLQALRTEGTKMKATAYRIWSGKVRSISLVGLNILQHSYPMWKGTWEAATWAGTLPSGEPSKQNKKTINNLQANKTRNR